MVSGDDEFNVCPAGQETEGFHDRIRDGLDNSMAELQERFNQIAAIPDAKRDDDETEFVQLFQKSQAKLQQMQNPELAYDAKYELASEVRSMINQMDLL